MDLLEGKEVNFDEFGVKDHLVYPWRNSWFGVANMAMFLGFNLYMFYMFSDASAKTFERIESDRGLLLIGVLLLCMQLIGVYHLYNVLVGTVNKTRLRVDQGFLSAQRGPLPWLSGCSNIEISKIKAVSVKTYKMLGIRDRIKYFKVVLDTDGGPRILERRIPHERDATELKKWLDGKIHSGSIKD